MSSPFGLSEKLVFRVLLLILYAKFIQDNHKLRMYDIFTKISVVNPLSADVEYTPHDR